MQLIINMNGVFNYNNAAYMRFAHTSCIVSVNREMLYFARSQFKVPIYINYSTVH